MVAIFTALRAGMNRARRLGQKMLTLVLSGVVLAAPVSSAATGDEDVRFRRLTEQQYRNTIADVFGQEIRVIGRFEPDMRVEGILAAGASRVSVTASGYSQYEQIARGIAQQVVSEQHRAALVGCGPSTADPAGRDCLQKFFGKFGLQLFRRPLNKSEMDILDQVASQAASRLKSFDQGLVAGLTWMLSSPEFLFRIDTYTDGGELDGWSRATRLSYFFWNTTPDSALLRAAESGELSTPQGYRAHVKRMMASPRFKSGVRAFFDDFLHLTEINTVNKDPLIYPQYVGGVAELAREQTLRTVVDTLVDRDLPYAALFTTRRMPMHRLLGPIYDIPVPAKGWSFHEFPEGDPRAGLLTQVSFLAAHSHPGRTSPTLRGIAVREILMCKHVPGAPANVSFTVVQDTSNSELKTTRERLKAHIQDAECATCHRVMDPPGLALEHFDGIGRYRSLENGVPIDTTGEIDKAHFDGAVELGRVLSSNVDVGKCLVDNSYRYAVGRGLREGDKRVLDDLFKKFREKGQRYPALMEAIALSPQFWNGKRSAEATVALTGPVKLRNEEAP